MFREKALKKYGGDMLPKFEHGGVHVGTSQDGVEVDKRGMLDKLFYP